jgi:NhaP-type Na+/H+ or K+/H+ antiporter
MSTDDILLGIGLVLVLAVGAQLLAARLRLPAIIVLLPVGMAAGALTDTVHPDALLGDLYQPFVSVAVGVILFEAGLRLSFAEAERDLRTAVLRLVTIGALVTIAGVALAARLIFSDLGDRLPLLVGAILVVSGPTVVLTLLAFVRPSRTVRAVLTWEGVLIDPIGALAGVLVFHAVRSGVEGGPLWRPGEMMLSIGVGAAIGVIGAVVLRLLVRDTQTIAPRLTVPVMLALVVAVLVAADLVRDDAGFVATTVLGIALANQHELDTTAMLEFQATLVQLLIGVLFILIAASVSWAQLSAVLAGGLVLVAAIVLVVRPLAVALATWRTGLPVRERAFLACVAPRGIVAGATASAFGLQLTRLGIDGADEILPIAFVAILGTVVVYGLAAGPAARLLGVEGARGTLVLVVGGSPAARAVAAGLDRAGVRVRLWVGDAEEQAAARAAGLEADRGRLLVDAVSREVELEEVTDALLITSHDDFNALAAAELRAELGHGHVHRIAPDGHAALLAPRTGDGRLPATFAELAAGARLLAVTPSGGLRVLAPGEPGRDGEQLV